MFLIQLDEDNKVISAMAITYAPRLQPLNASYMLCGDEPMPGQTFDPVTKQFSNPPRKRWVTKLAFDNRFTMTESVGLKLAQVLPARLTDETDAAYAARCSVPMQLQVMSERRSMATYIDLDRTDTRAGVQQLEVLGLLAAGRALEILDAPIADHEFYPTA